MKTELLCGHSGCKIEKCTDENGNVFVRKTSGSKDYNARLLKQIEKQAAYTCERGLHIKVPAIIKCGYNDDGLFYADMEYIDGEPFSRYILDPANTDTEDILRQIINNAIAVKSEKTDSHSFSDKLDSVIPSLEKYAGTSPCYDYALRLRNSNAALHLSAHCHGDLTFENIMVARDGTIYLIDTLDVFCECVEADISKLLQDAYFGWCYRHDAVQPEYPKSKYAAKIIRAYTDKFGSDSEVCLRNMMLLTLLRIYPYAKDEKTVAFLNNALKEAEYFAKAMTATPKKNKLYL